ncbi:MAG: DUF3500 domain-containing protein [Phycisphaerales bacterium]|nr:DUF3500 domain-containing protein [Phycisphaerales bacterium]
MLWAILSTSLLVHGPHVQAAMEWAKTLEDSPQAQAPMHHEARLAWNYLPGERFGLRLSEMTGPQRDGAMELLQSVLSHQGFETVGGIMLLEGELRDRAIAAGRPDPSRDPEQYTWALWGEPGEGPWGFRVEGHHLSLNVTETADGTRTTPLFLGAAPLRIDEGPHEGTAPLDHIETIALALRNTLNAEQAAKAVLSDDKPHDVLLRPGHEDRLTSKEGLCASELTSPQRAMLLRLINAYAQLLEPRLGNSARARLLAEGPDSVTLGWIGGTSINEPRYWRMHGPDWVIEFDSVGDDPGHVHTVWHDLRGNFGADLLRDHLNKDHLNPNR